MAVESGLITLTLPKNQDIPSTFTGSKSFTVDSDFATALKPLYDGSFGKPKYWASPDAVTITADSGLVHRGSIKLSRGGVNQTLSVPSMLSNISGAITKLKALGYKATPTRQ